MSSQSRKACEWIKAAPPGTLRTQQQAALVYGITQASISAAMARHGTARHGTARHGTARHNAR